ncbi:AMP-binding protein [Agrobacterium sp.]|uniref:AMP-binding protein n=1 Tax=Agrobacterium sp. TaxID=361 RepID=UPI0028B074E2|nr:AMP-binding protein [Agrobacterium sp.]
MTFVSAVLDNRRGSTESLLVREGDAELLIQDFLAAADGSDRVCRKIAVSTSSSIFLIRVLAAADGRAESILLLSPALPVDTVFELMRQCSCEEIYSDRLDIPGSKSSPPKWNCSSTYETTWLLTTSGTTGVPKVVQHTFHSISASTKSGASLFDARWGLLFEASRFAGMQVLFQALIGGGVLLATPGEWSLGEKVSYFAATGCTHLSATPTLWRKMLMSPRFAELQLRQLTVGGEIADSNLLAGLSHAQPQARISHIYASTEIGVGFAVHDGLAGFPSAFLQGVTGIDLKVIDGVLWAKPADARSTIFANHIERDADGFVCTGDRVNVTSERVFFLGRESSLVNIGGVKIQIEDVEAVIRSHPDVSECYIEAKTNSFSGSVLVLTLALIPGAIEAEARRDIRQWCKDRLQREAQPATIRIVEQINSSPAGKISRVV